MAPPKRAPKAAPEQGAPLMSPSARAESNDSAIHGAVLHNKRIFKGDSKREVAALEKVIGDEKGQITPAQAQRLADKGVISGFGTKKSEARIAAEKAEAEREAEDETVRENG